MLNTNSYLYSVYSLSLPNNFHFYIDKCLKMAPSNNAFEKLIYISHFTDNFLKLLRCNRNVTPVTGF